MCIFAIELPDVKSHSHDLIIMKILDLLALEKHQMHHIFLYSNITPCLRTVHVVSKNWFVQTDLKTPFLMSKDKKISKSP